MSEQMGEVLALVIPALVVLFVVVPYAFRCKRQEERDLCKLCHHHEKRHYQGTYCVLCRCPQFEKRR